MNTTSGGKKKCHWFWGHNWGNWITFESGEIHSSLHGGQTGYYIFQQRECIDCRYKEIKEQRT